MHSSQGPLLSALLEEYICLNITGMRGKMVAHFSHEAGGAAMHYSSRCEMFALARFLNNSQKNIKKSLAQEMVRRAIFWNVEYYFILQKV